MCNITSKTKYLKSILYVGTMLLSFAAFAQLETPFTPRYSEAINGDMTMIANNVTSAHPTNSYIGGENNQDNLRVFVDIDSDPSTFNSSSANFANPSPSSPCLTINKAYLYWSAADKEYGIDNGNITGDGNPEPVWDYRDIMLMLPGESTYTTITADDVMYQGRPDHYQNDGYAAVKDITDVVNALANPFGTYQVANLKATEGSLYSHNNNNAGVTGGWQIIFVYESPDLVKRNVTLFDGFAIVHTAGGFNNYDVNFNGFQTVPNGKVNANILFGSIDGDRSLFDDQLRIEDTDGVFQGISTSVRDENNFFRSSITVDGNDFLNRNPASTNTLGFDAGHFELKNNGNKLIDNNQTSTTIKMTSSGDLYSLYLMGISVEVFEPSLGALSFTTNVIGSNFDPGDNAPVEIRIKNVGNDNIQNLEIALTLPPQVEFLNTEPLPPGVTYNFDNATRELRFFVEDGYTDTDDPEYELDFNLFINNECVTCSAAIGLQALATFTGETNPNTVGTLSSGTVDICGIGNHDPTFLYVTPVLSIGDGSATEGDNIVFNISSSHLLAEDAILNLAYTNITASASDYALANTFTVPTGTGNTSFDIPALDDSIIEVTETFDITASSIANITLLDDTARGSILDNDLVTGNGIAFTNTNVVVNEGTDAFAVYTVTLTGAISENVTVDYTTNEGTALNPGDFTTTSGTLTFTPTVGSFDIQVPITDDSIIENTENFTVVLSNIVSNLGISFVDGNTTNTANGTINDDDANPGDGIAFTNTNVVVTEGTDAFAVYTVTLTGAISENVTVDYATNEGTALNPEDFVTTTGTLTFTPTVGSLDIQVPITDDNIIEVSENFTVVLSNVQSNLGLGIVGPDTANTTINDDDANPGDGIAFTNTNVVVTEGTDAFAVYTVTLTGAISENVTVDYTTNEGTALNPGDFVTTTGTLTFTPTVGSLDIQVPITDDNIIEVSENFTVVLSNVQSNLGLGIVGPDTANTTINDDDANPGDGIAFTNTNVVVTEGTDAFAVYTVTLTGAISENVTVDYTTNEGTALNPGDFTTTSGTLTFTPTVNSLDIQVPITDDAVIEVQEDFSITLSNIQSNLGIGFVDGNTTNTANGTINDDDANPGDGIAFTNTNVVVTEGTDAFAVYTVTLTGAISENVTVDYTTNEGTAINPGDFVTTTGTLTFTPTVGSLDIQVPITDDAVIEVSENFTVVLSNVQSNLGLGIVGPDTANTTINDDDANPGDGIAFTNTNVVVTEGTDAFAVYTVTLTGAISENVTVDYTTNEGTALNPGDFTTTSGTLTFTPTVGSLDIQVPITDDNIIEVQENFSVTLSNIQSNLGIGFVDGNTTNTANGTINDDDANPGDGIAFTNTNVVVTEGTDAFAVYTVTLTGAISENVTVDYTTNEGTALNPGDFVTTTGTLTFTPTVGSLDIQVPITDDNIIEVSENFTVVLSNVQSNLGLGIVGPDTANTTINDDDANPGDGIAFTNTNVVVTEGTDAFAVYTVTLTGAISENVTVDYTTNEGTALNPGDFTTTSGTLTFTPTVNSLDIQVPITDDMASEPTEGFGLILSNIQSNLGIGFVDGNTTNAANGTINDDDMAEIMVEPYIEEHTIMCGEALPEVPTLVFTGGCGNYTVDFTEVEEFTVGIDDYMVVRTWNVTDSCGNTASFQQIIFVMQLERETITIDICTGDDAIDLLNSLPTNFDRTGNFIVNQGDVILNGSLFEPMNLELGEYLISYESTDTSCKFYADYIINVNADCLPCDINDLVVSKTITVNGDGINDYFEITGLEDCGYTYQVMVFNRWGTKVFESNDYSNDWGGYAPTGSFGGSGILPTGTYYYMISLSDPEIQPVNGYIYIGSDK
ncbi:Calx-beta domain-containing protein [Maribacter algarum]|nr:Calx-beta domain-containing protein [Maribacter algarum]